MFAITMEGGMLMSAEDICLTPAGPAVVALPYPNTAEPPLGEPVCETVLICGLPTLNLVSKIPLSEGDDPGMDLGVMSGLVMGEASFTVGSVKVFLQGNPAVRLTTPTMQNGTNCEGTCLVPGQTVVSIME